MMNTPDLIYDSLDLDIIRNLDFKGFRVQKN